MPSHYIDSLLSAGLVYYQSKNVASFDPNGFLAVLRSVRLLGSAGVRDVVRMLQREVSRRDVSGYLALGWHLGLLGYYQEGGRGVYTVSRLGERVLRACGEVPARPCLDELKPIFVSWQPLVVLSRFLRSEDLGPSLGGKTLKRVTEVLGGEMERWTSVMLKLGLPVGAPRPVKKPFNDYVVRKLFEPLLELLGLPESCQPDKRVYWGRNGEPIVAVSVADLVLESGGGRVLLATYVADDHGLGLVLRSIRLAPRRPSYVIVVVRKTAFDVEKVRGEVRSLREESSVEVELLRSNAPLHTKLYASERMVMFSSANLTHASLYKNVEFAALLKDGKLLEEAEPRVVAFAKRVI